MAERVSQVGIIVEYTHDEHPVRVSQAGTIVEYEPDPTLVVSQAGVAVAWIPQQGYIYTSNVQLGARAAAGAIYAHGTQLGAVPGDGAIYVIGASLGE